MLLDSLETVRRLVIYFFYDADGVVDRYVPYLLQDMRKNCTELFVVCNGKLTPEGRKALEEIPAQVMVRENKGFDVWAYKTALAHYGWEALAQFDEVVLMNFTVFGPLYPFFEVFAEMNGRDVDFWGMTKYYKLPFDPYGTTGLGYLPEHIQSYFLCIRKPVLKSVEFQKYWEDMGAIKNYADAVGKHEAIFTKTFTEYGFRCDTYVRTDDLETCTQYPLIFEAKELIQHRRCPVFKRKMFMVSYHDCIARSVGQTTVDAYAYIRRNFSYDMEMVWENILRTGNMADIKDCMHLNFVLSKSECTEEEGPAQKVALMMHLYFEDLLDECMQYAAAMPAHADIYLSVSKDSMYQAAKKAAECLAPRKVSVLKIENRGRDVSALLVAFAPYVNNYDVVCLAHDKRMGQISPGSVGKSFSYKTFENVLGSKEYVCNILKKFAEDSRLGMLMPPPPNHGPYYGNLGTEWGPNYDHTKKLAEDLQIKVDIDKNKEPISPLGTMFWFRPKALEPLFRRKWVYEDFPEEPNAADGTLLHAIERLYGFSVQSQGFYCAWLMNDAFARIELTNLHFMLREETLALRRTRGISDSIWGTVRGLYDETPKLPPLRLQIKQRLKARIPSPLWRVFKGIYHLFGGKKWLG